MPTTATPRTADFHRERELLRKTYEKEIPALAASAIIGAGLELPQELQAHAGNAEALDMGTIIERCMRLEDRPRSDAYLYASGGMGATLATEVTDEVYRMVVRQQFEAPLESLLSICVAGEAGTLTKELRPIIEAGEPPTPHAKGGAAESGEVRILRVENVRIGVFTQYLWVDEMDEVLAAAPALAASVGRSIASLDADLIIGTILGGILSDGDAVCSEAAGNLLTGKALNVANIGDGYAAMREQLANSERITNHNVVPDVLLTGSRDYFQAMQELALLSGTPLRAVEDPRIQTGVRSHTPDDVVIAGATAGTWWLLDSRRAIERTVLKGYGGPSVQIIRRDGEDGQWGIGWSIRHMVAVTPLDRTCIRQFEE